MIFVKRDAPPQQGFNVGVMLNKKTTKGEVGIEVEVEGSKLPKSQDELAPFWEYHIDNSLRGQDNAEYVLRQPLAFKEVPGALDALWNLFQKYNSTLDESNRTSIHVHLNAQTFFMNRLTSMLALYFTFEDVLTQWCGDHRVGNLFCLRAKDAPGIISQVRRFIRSDGKTGLSEHLHYGGLNVHALAKFGSLEFRALRGCPDKETIQQWLDILQRLYDLSAQFTDPREICQNFSGEGPLGFFNTILGPSASVVRNGIDLSDEQIKDSLYEGIRLAQDLCYCRDWSLFSPVDIQADPFGRDAKKMAKKLASVAADWMDNALSTISDSPAPTPGWMNIPISPASYDPFAPAQPAPMPTLAPGEEPPEDDDFYIPDYDEDD